MTQLKIFSSICLQVFKIFVDFTLLHGEIGGDTRPLDIVGHGKNKSREQTNGNKYHFGLVASLHCVPTFVFVHKYFKQVIQVPKKFCV